MGILYITEFADPGLSFPTVATQPPLAEQAVTYTTTTASTVFNASTAMVRLHTDSICSIEFASGATPTATTAKARMAANQTEYFKVPRGQGYSVAAVSNT